MMLSLRTRLFIMVSLAVLAVLGISILLIVRSSRQEATPPDETAADENATPVIDSSNFDEGNVVGAPTETSIPAGTPVRTPTTAEAEQRAVREYARLFVERYGSFSTDSNYQNIRELETLVTPDLWSRLSIRLAAKPAAGSFNGVTTSAIGSELTSWNESQATVKVLTVRREQKGSNPETTTQQTVMVTLIKNGSAWLVDSFVAEK